MKKTISFIFLAFLLSTTVAFGQKIDTAKINSYLAYIGQNNWDIGSVSIFKNGKEVYNRSFGQQKGLQFNKDTKYHVGSVSKLFTATLIFKLIDEGKLSLQDSLSEFFPKIPTANKITIRNLLEHSSGLGDYDIKNDSIYDWLSHPVTEQQILNEIIRQGSLFPPGDSVVYSNSGYYLLGKIVEKKFGMRFDQTLSQNITGPLGLSNIESSLSFPKNVFSSYYYKNGKWLDRTDFYFPNCLGDGGIVATTKALNEFIIDLFHGQIISSKSLDIMMPDTGKEIFGRGMMLIPFYQHISYGHGGDTWGTHSMVAFNPQDSLAIAFAINGERYPHNDFAIGLLSIIYGYDFDLPEVKKMTLTAEDLSKYLGVYSNPRLPIKIEIRKNGDTLTAQGTGQKPFDLTPYNTDKFHNIELGIDIEFQPADNKLTLYQGGNTISMTKE